MSVSLVLKSLRKRREMSQQQLANALGVNVMTISRLESKENASFTPRMVSKIARFIDDEDLAMFDPSDPQDMKIISDINYINHQNLSVGSALNGPRRRNSEWASDVSRQIEAPLQGVGYTLVEKKECYLFYRNQENNKEWLFICDTLESFHGNLELLLRDKIGYALLFNNSFQKNKITIAISFSCNEIARYLPQNISQSLPFDLSVLHFDDDCTIQQETYLRFNTDGRGIFDLDVDDTAVNAQAGKDYLAWTRAVGNIVMLEKNKK